ncbi:MAG: preprotein translocase subunit SecY [archaeon]
MDYEALLQKLPGVETPKKRQTFNQKLKWTGVILLSYFLLSDTFLLGVSPERLAYFEQLAALIGASMGSIITLGIGPIVSASIILQLLVGAKVIAWDLSTHHGKVMFQGTQKILAFTFAFVEAAAYTMFGAIDPIVHTTAMMLFVIAQLTLGGWLIIFMDEVVSKWGFGSGVSLFIAAGVSKQILIRGFSILSTNSPGKFDGIIPGMIQEIVSGTPTLQNLLPFLLPIVSTLSVFVLVVYAQSMRVEIPLAFGSIRGFGRKWPLKFIYTNVMPVILTSAILINLQVWGKMLSDRGFALLGKFSENGDPTSGLMFFLTPPRSFAIEMMSLSILLSVILGVILAYVIFKEKEYIIVAATAVIGIIIGTYIVSAYSTLPTIMDMTRVLTYVSFYMIGCAIFSMFWVSTSGMDAKNVARQIQGSGMQIPGFRRDPRVIERVLLRYIPPLAILGGAFVGFLSAFADFSGSIVQGTGLLLTVMIIYQLYEQLATQHLEDMHPMLRQFMQK